MQFVLFAVDVEPKLLFAFLGGIILAYVLVRFLAVPFKYIWQIAGSLAKGAAVLLLINVMGLAFAFGLPFNVVNALIVGYLGVPGIILVVLVQRVL